MIINFDELDKIKFKFIDLGMALSDLSENNDTYFNEIKENNTKIKKSLASAIDQDSLKSTVDSANSISQKVDEFSNSISNISLSFSGMKSLESSLEAASTKLASFANDLDKMSKSPDPTGDGVYGKTRIGGKKPARGKKEISKVSALLKKGSNITSKALKDPLSKLGLPSKLGAGAAVSTAIMWMSFGFTETQRLKAQAGMARNVLVSAVDGAVGSAVDKGVTWLSQFAEKMNKFYGISEKEVMGLAQKFAHLGFSVDETINKKVGPAVDNLHGNFMALSLSMDKMLEQATGTNAAKMGEYAHKYGMSLKESSDALLKMYSLGKTEGSIGSITFLNSIESSMDALATMGYKISSVIDVFEVMRKRFEAVGVPKFLAAATVSTGIKEITSGMADASMDVQTFLAGAAGYSQDAEGRNKFIDNMTRLMEDDPDRWKREVLAIITKVSDKVNGNMAVFRDMMRELGWGKTGSLLAENLLEAQQSGETFKVKQAEDALLSYNKENKDALDTESKKMNELKKLLNEWQVGQRLMGQGLLGIALDTVSLMFAFFKSIPAVIGTFLQVDQKKGAQQRDVIMDKLASFTKNMPIHFDLMGESLKSLSGTAGKMANVALKTSADMAMEAFTFNPMKHVADKVAANDKWGVGGSGTAPVTKIVTIPIPTKDMSDSPQRTNLNPMTTDSIAAGVDLNWVGGQINLVNYGVTEDGDIRLGLEGNCPRCGLRYSRSGNAGVDTKGYSDTTAYSDSTATGENSVMHPKGDELQQPSVFNESKSTEESRKPIKVSRARTGESIKVDPMSEGGMENIAALTTPKGKESHALDPKLGGILQSISEKFPGKTIKIHSAYREGPSQHGKGKAMDISVQDVHKKDLFKFVRTLPEAKGRGYYPHRTQPYVHVDVRSRKKPVEWVDFTKSGTKTEKHNVFSGSEGSSWLDAELDKYDYDNTGGKK